MDLFSLVFLFRSVLGALGLLDFSTNSVTSKQNFPELSQPQQVHAPHERHGTAPLCDMYGLGLISANRCDASRYLFYTNQSRNRIILKYNGGIIFMAYSELYNMSPPKKDVTPLEP